MIKKVKGNNGLEQTSWEFDANKPSYSDTWIDCSMLVTKPDRAKHVITQAVDNPDSGQLDIMQAFTKRSAGVKGRRKQLHVLLF